MASFVTLELWFVLNNKMFKTLEHLIYVILVTHGNYFNSLLI